jgi:putative nucleotidyltransferase with HDIG domain
MIPKRMVRYTALVGALAVCLVVSLLGSGEPDSWLPVLVLVALAVLTENFAFHLPIAGSVSLSFAALYAALLHSGPLAGVVVAIACASNVEEFREGKPVVLRLFNAGQLVLSAGAAGIAYESLGGSLLSNGNLDPLSVLPAAAASAVVFYMINVTLVGYAASILSNRSLRAVLREQGFLSYGSSLLVLALIGLLVAQLLALNSWMSLALLILPFMSARRTFRVYVELTEAYTDTVRSLVAAIEAKDPYTRGHSERVAIYSKRLAEQLHFPQSEVELIERAALLHDVGKIGINLDTLTSPSRLSADEVREIRTHPVLGSELVESVEFLSDVVPIIRHHHERIDGAGYPSGLLGGDIPRLARVLATADAYDAMTSDRAYRPGMPKEEARQELERVSGTQLDSAMVWAFVEGVLADEDPGVKA